MPHKNQKVMSDEEKEIVSKNSKIKQENEFKDKLTIKQAERLIFEREKENLPQVLNQRLQEIEIALENELDDIVGLKSARIHQLISRQSNITSGAMIGYTAKELFIVYDVYQQLVEKINRFTLYIPSIKSFCAFAGFSTNTFKNLLQSPDEEKRNVAQMIDDYISDMLLDASKMRKTDASTSIFVAKSEHGMTEAVNPQSIQHTTQVDLGQIFNRIEEIKKGVVVDAEFKEKDK